MYTHKQCTYQRIVGYTQVTHVDKLFKPKDSGIFVDKMILHLI